MVVIVGGLLLGVYCTLSPALVQPFMRKVTGSNDLAYGHTTSFGVIMGALVGKLFKKHENESSESLKIPAKLSFLKDIIAVSYTHLDVYKRQAVRIWLRPFSHD